MRVLVTGGASGLGAALVRAYAARGADVLVADLAPAQSTSAHTPSITLDVRSDDDWAAAAAWVEREWGGLDVLVNNAGIAGGGRVDVAALEEWERLIAVNLLGVVRGTRTFTPMLKRQRAGRIVNVASLAGLVHPAGMGSYNATKAAVVAFSETVGHELAAYGVRVSVVCPSYFRTGLMDHAVGADTAVAAVVSKLVADSAVGPDEIAAEVLAGLDRDEEVILPDDAGRAAYRLKRADRAAYDQVMRAQAERLDRVAGETREDGQ